MPQLWLSAAALMLEPPRFGLLGGTPADDFINVIREKAEKIGTPNDCVQQP